MKQRDYGILPLMAIALVAPVCGQTVPGSCIVTRTVLSSDSTRVLEQRSYDNGLGDVIQDIRSFPGTQYPDIVVLHEYDDYRRLSKSWLPVTSPSGGGYVSANSVGYMAPALYNDAAPFSRTEYDGFLPSQPSAVRKAGALWQSTGKTVSFTYSEYVGSGMFTGAYDTGYIYTLPDVKYLCTRTLDEDGLLRAEYTDLRGRLMISETSQGRTYYIYDLKGDVCYVIPPALSAYILSCNGPGSEVILDTDEMIQKYAYVYRYDNQRHCLYKKLPGCAPVYYVYDRTGTCILSQDGNQRQRQEWTYTIPDKFGRPAIRGVCHNSVSYSSEPLHQAYVYAEYDGTSTATGGYAVHNLTLASQTLHSAVYYDNYSFIGHHGVPTSLTASTVPGYPVDNSLGHGLQTGSATAVIDDSGVTGYTYSAMYYDSRHNVSQTRSTNHLGGMDVTLTSFSYTGKPLSVRRQHSASGRSAIDVTRSFTYDGKDRVTHVTHSVNGTAPVTLASYTYDDLGRVSTKTVGGMETTSYTYNVRSWPTRISGQRFTERLCYNTTVDGLNPILPHQYCWSGRVGAYAWQSGGETRQRGYGLVYDDLGRLISANYGEGTFLGNYMGLYDEKAEYDGMGNPTWVYRKSPNSLNGSRTSSPSDRLLLEYDGNQLVHVTDSVTSGHTYAGAFHFADGADEAVEYEYDENGNMTKDLNRKISSVEYNLLNLPSMIEFEDHSFIRNTYSAAGEKLSTSYGIRFAPVVSPLSAGNAGGETPQGGIVIPGDGGIPGDDPGDPEPQAGQFRYYCGDVVYDMGTTRLLTDEGYVTFSSDGTPQYHYYLRDHLGNVRVVFDQTDAVEQVNHYYAFGGLMRESTNPGVQPYKYGGKELDRTGGLDAYDFGARSYFADRLQWGTMDPLCEKYYDVTPYGYCLNDPVNAIDLHGDSITIFDMASIDAIYNALQKGTNLSMKFTNGVLVPESIQQIASNSQDSFLRDLYNISINPQMVEIATTYINDYYIGNQYHFGTWSVPTETDYAKDHNRGQEDLLHPSGLTLVGNLGQTLYPISSDEYKRSTNNNIRININALGSINQRSCGIAHEFGHVILYLSRKPHSHSQNGDFIYGRQWNVMKRFGYDYLESSTGKIFR